MSMMSFVGVLLQWTLSLKVSYLLTVVTLIFGVVSLLTVISFLLKLLWRSILLVTILLEVSLFSSLVMGG